MCSKLFQKCHKECEAIFDMVGMFDIFSGRSHGFEAILKGFRRFSGVPLMF